MSPLQLPHYLAMLARAEHTLADAHRAVTTGHAADADVAFACAAFARQGQTRAAALEAICERYPLGEVTESERLHPPALGPARTGSLGLLRDLADLHQLATFTEFTWEQITQAAHGARDTDLINLGSRASPQLASQLAWLRMRMRTESAQALLAG